ncbi:long-chain fatty acid--CoA ligase [Patescibacteria group bacterium]|nr:long-chain fatty acid--CoA ligase [Patescibacteria group bacterium]
MLTISSKFQSIAQMYADHTALAFLDHAKYHKITYHNLDLFRLRLAETLNTWSWKKQEKVAVMLVNGPEWIISDLAASTLGLVIVPLHLTYNQLQLEQIIKHAQVDYLIIQEEYFHKFQDLWLDFSFKTIVVVGQCKKQSEKIKLWPNLENMPNSFDFPNFPVSENDLHTIIYTSGTTGDPKGVMLSHKNLISDVMAAKEAIDITFSDRFFSFLPLSHAFERVAGYYAPIFSGASIYFARNSKTIVEDIKIAQPTVLNAVPRIFEKVYDKVFDKIRTGSDLKKRLFYQALNLAKYKKQRSLQILEKVQLYFLDKIVLRKLRHILGGNLRLAISGGASLNPAIAKFFGNLGIQVIEGYGLTETSPIVAVNQIKNYKFGTVGKILRCNQVVIAPDKEILIKGDNLMQGYYNNRELTTEVVDQEGYFHTGDLGFLDSDGFLTIIGRAKDMIVLSTGKNIFPEPIENTLNESKYIAQSFVYGDKQKNIASLIVPDFTSLESWCKQNEVDYLLPEVLHNSKVLTLYENVLAEKLKDFSHLEKVNDFSLIGQEFTQENGLLTPTLKLRRNKIKEKYL